jgi:hypothetical protein
MGQVDFSPEIQLARRTITAWSLLIKKASGLKVSSRLLQKSMKKAIITYNLWFMGLAFIDEHLILSYKHYYSIKGAYKMLHNTAREIRAEALAAERNIDKEKMLNIIHHRELQRITAGKTRYLQGKISTGSTTVGRRIWIQKPHAYIIRCTTRHLYIR